MADDEIIVLLISSSEEDCCSVSQPLNLKGSTTQQNCVDSSSTSSNIDMRFKICVFTRDSEIQSSSIGFSRLDGINFEIQGSTYISHKFSNMERPRILSRDKYPENHAPI